MTARVQVTVHGAGDATWDDVTGYETPPDRVVLYTGPGRVQPDFRATEVEHADQDTSVRRYLIALLAASPRVPYGALVAVLSCAADPGLVGTTFFVFDAPEANERFQRNLICTRTATPGVTP